MPNLNVLYMGLEGSVKKMFTEEGIEYSTDRLMRYVDMIYSKSHEFTDTVENVVGLPREQAIAMLIATGWLNENLSITSPAKEYKLMLVKETEIAEGVTDRQILFTAMGNQVMEEMRLKLTKQVLEGASKVIMPHLNSIITR